MKGRLLIAAIAGSHLAFLKTNKIQGARKLQEQLGA
jgi:hypothetical protein